MDEVGGRELGLGSRWRELGLIDGEFGLGRELGLCGGSMHRRVHVYQQ